MNKAIVQCINNVSTKHGYYMVANGDVIKNK